VFAASTAPSEFPFRVVWTWGLYWRAKDCGAEGAAKTYMAIPYVAELHARLRARFHVQLELTYLPSEFQTPTAITVEGFVIHVFRGGSSLSLGDKLTFDVNVCRRGDLIPPFGPTYQLYDKFLRARYVETFLNGTPPRCGVAVDFMILSAPTRKPLLQGSRLAYMLERLKWVVR
jgi:hypothetical protein